MQTPHRQNTPGFEPAPPSNHYTTESTWIYNINYTPRQLLELQDHPRTDWCTDGESVSSEELSSWWSERRESGYQRASKPPRTWDPQVHQGGAPQWWAARWAPEAAGAEGTLRFTVPDEEEDHPTEILQTKSLKTWWEQSSNFQNVPIEVRESDSRGAWALKVVLVFFNGDNQLLQRFSV